jgi:hypothetical protein
VIGSIAYLARGCCVSYYASLRKLRPPDNVMLDINHPSLLTSQEN